MVKQWTRSLGMDGSFLFAASNRLTCAVKWPAHSNRADSDEAAQANRFNGASERPRSLLRRVVVREMLWPRTSANKLANSANGERPLGSLRRKSPLHGR